MAISHANSEKHKRQLRYHEEILSASSGSSLILDDYDILRQNVIDNTKHSSIEGRCLLCRVSLPDFYQTLTHICSKRHRQNLDWYQRVHAAKALGKFTSARETDQRALQLPFENDLYDAIPAPENFIISSEVWSLIQDLPEGMVVREWEYFCELCECKCLSDELMIEHLGAHSHNAIRGLKKIERGGGKSRPRTVSRYRDTDWEAAVTSGAIPSPPLNRRPLQS